MQATNLEIANIVYNTLLPFILVNHYKQVLSDIREDSRWMKAWGWLNLIIIIFLIIGKIYELIQFIKARTKKRK